MISAIDFRPGSIFIMDGNLQQVISYHHIQRPRLAPLVRVKLKNLKTGAQVERTLSPEDKFEEPTLEYKELQYSYSTGNTYVFMDTQTFEQYEFTKEQIGDSVVYLKEEAIVKMLLHKGEVIGIELPHKVDLKIVSTPPGIKGDTAGSAKKTATLETGAVVQVPLFVKEGDIIRVDTRTGEYVERVRS